MANNKVNDLSALDWDDSALIKAYNKGMSLRVKDFEEEFAKEHKQKKKDSKKGKWSVGDYCRAIYPSDNLTYEGKIVEMNGDSCIVEFLGYNEELEMDMDTLSKSKGKHARKKQIKNAKRELPCSEDESGTSIDDSRNDRSDMQNISHHRRSEPVIDHSANYTTGDSTFQNSIYPAPAPNHCVMPPPPGMMPPAPMFNGLDMNQNSSLSSMLSSWYMAGYYTGYHQAQRNQSNQHCCRSGPNHCH